MLRCITDWVSRRKRVTPERDSARLAPDFASSPQARMDLLDRTIAKLTAQGDKFDPHSSMLELREDAIRSMSQAWGAAEIATIQAYLDQMDELDKRIYNLSRDKLKHKEIAERTNTDVPTVRKVLARIFVDLRMILLEQDADRTDAA